ncbi:hypothetical protein DXT99_06570 [Pontibacter diazotrophicus]|uniref:AEC family transporter n=1 Tax=Pontibacter diazotrophicus TaxID=1400979 RepID=A0A3D8LF50_9BACT|nr:AEC family transporter [Pontibacter diazotrophicus]RDV16028.1 hypothetical protein DXT99_06570 [Pontibacter diazotrophicus]
MDILNKLVSNVLPLYAFIGVGYIASRWLGLKSKFVSVVLLYGLIPLVIFDNLVEADLMQFVVVAAIVFLMCLLMSIPGWLTHKYLVKDFNKYLLSCGFSYFNIGWFGIPVVLAIFGEERLPLIISAYMGNVFYGNTIGYFLVSRSKELPVKESVKNVFMIPAIYACVAAIIANIAGFEMPESLSPVMEGASWVLSALGMVMIGIGLSKVNLKETDYRKFGKIIGVRYLAAGVIMGLLVLGEAGVIGQLEAEEQMLLLMLPAFPIAANLVVFASFLETEEKEASLLVSLTSIISLIVVPIASLLLF